MKRGRERQIADAAQRARTQPDGSLGCNMNRIRLEIVNGDSAVTDVLWTHYYAPNKIGTDTIYHSADYPSVLTLPVTEGA